MIFRTAGGIVSEKQTIITFSHLRWDFVYQRPQHLMSRLASWRRVLFIEEPWYTPDTQPFWERIAAGPGVTVCRLHTPAPEEGFHDRHIATFHDLLPQLLAEEQLSDYLTWMYTPMALPLARELNPQAVVYDCMDELSAFANAPAELLRREADLLEWSDLVFTGGPSLYRAKRDRHSS